MNDLNGINALTGKSNFDISEWMLSRFVDFLKNTDGCLAMLIKMSVARKIIQRMFKNEIAMVNAAIYKIDAAKEFEVSVDICLLVVRFSEKSVIRANSCTIFNNLDQAESIETVVWRGGRLVSNPLAYDRLAPRHLASSKPEIIWRSGIKHDCSAVFELKIQGNELVNGYGEVVDVEDEYLFPLLKCTDLARDRKVTRWVLCPQRYAGEDTTYLANHTPRLWKYLEYHSSKIAKRRSKIYLNKPRFSIFGVGPYSFRPWKIAISGLHKSYDFRLIGPHNGKPVLFDDTCYQLGFDSQQEAKRIYNQVTEDDCVEFLNSITFWDNKRPVTAEILNQLRIEFSK